MNVEFAVLAYGAYRKSIGRGGRYLDEWVLLKSEEQEAWLVASDAVAREVIHRIAHHTPTPDDLSGQ